MKGRQLDKKSLTMLLLKTTKKVQLRETNRAKSDQDSLGTRGCFGFSEKSRNQFDSCRELKQERVCLCVGRNQHGISAPWEQTVV